jgi:general secretion pathway protein D
MVFLRPVVIRDASGSDALSNSRYEQMRGLQQASQPLPNSVMPINESAVMPEAPKPKPRPAAVLPPAQTTPVR